MSDNAPHSGWVAQNDDLPNDLMSNFVATGVSREMNCAEMLLAKKRATSPVELSDGQKNKIKENAIKKMKQINAVIKDFSANIEAIK
jgi:hypothetical protein